MIALFPLNYLQKWGPMHTKNGNFSFFAENGRQNSLIGSGGPRPEILCNFRGRAGHFFVFFLYPIFYHLFFYEYLLEMRSHSHQNGQISSFLENERHMSLIEQIWRSRQEILCSFRGLAEKSDILATVTENTKTHFPNHMKINQKNY